MLLGALAAGCGGDPSGPGAPAPVATVAVTPAAATLLVGATTQLAATVRDTAGNELTGRAVTWASTAPAVAGVSATGGVTGMAVGSATIMASAEGKNGTAAITVQVLPTIRAMSGDAQVDTVAQTLPQALVVEVTGSDGTVSAGVVVSFAVGAGGGSLAAASDTTDAGGRASTLWTLGTVAGANTVTASGSVLSGSLVTFRATAVADAPATLAKVSADSQTGFVNRQLAPPPEVRVGDRFGNALPGVSVAWAVTTGGGTVSAPATNTGPSGLASVSWTLGTAPGPNELEATVAGVAPVRFSVTAVAGGPGRIAFNRDDFEIYVMTAEATGLTRLTNNVASDYAPSWSPDGSKIAFTTSRFGNLEIAVMNGDGSGVARLTNDTRVDEVPAWSPDGQRIAFTREWAADRWDIYVMNADGSGVTNVTNNMKNAGGPTWSPDGSRIAFGGRVNPGDPTQIWVINVDGSGLTGLNVEGTPAWSPDGSKIAYQSDRIYLMNPDGSGVTAIADSAYGAPAWAPDGSRIAFTSRRNGIVEIYSVAMDGSGLVRLTNHPATEYNVAWGR
jgi:hypothetical protein